jgi:hypothetical protein
MAACKRWQLTARCCSVLSPVVVTQSAPATASRLSPVPFGALDADVSHEAVLTLAEYCPLLEGVVLTSAQVGDEEITLRRSAAAPN